MSRAGTDAVAPSPMAIALAPMVEVWRALLAAHTPDESGQRCRTCQWQTHAADRWPCNIYVLAAAASRAATMRGLRPL